MNWASFPQATVIALALFSGSLSWNPTWAPVCTQAWAETPPAFSELDRELGFRIDRVQEFRFLREQAQKMGVRVWLFGGLATSYGHYVRRDLRRAPGTESGSLVFDYDLASIITLSQDLDIVVDGTAEQAEQLEAALSKAFPHSQANKSAWEVRPLRVQRPPKEALLGNSNFLNQHTDSASTGMIEVTTPPSGQSRVRDLRAFDATRTEFLNDLEHGKIRYYFSSKHAGTALAKEGRNPEILSVIRYLVKLFRHGLEPSVEDLETITKVVGRFDPVRDLRNSYVKDWMEKNVRKLIADATDLEHLWNVMDQVGLRVKLRSFGDRKKIGTIAWWMDKEPLKSRSIARPLIGRMQWSKTARQLGLSVIAHTTTDFWAYESIRRAFDGRPNAFLSRNDVIGEVASKGDGFYAATGRSGWRPSGYTIRFNVEPEAVEGEDFILVKPYKTPVPDNVEIIIKNKDAIRVIAEPEIATFHQYFSALVDASKGAQNEGVIQRFRRRIAQKKMLMTPEERKWAWETAKDDPRVFAQWLETEESKLDMEIELKLVEKAIVENKVKENKRLLRHWFAQEVSARRPDLMERLIQKDAWDVMDFWNGEKTPGPWAPQFRKIVVQPGIVEKLLDVFIDSFSPDGKYYSIDPQFWLGFLTPQEARAQLENALATKNGGTLLDRVEKLFPIADREVWPEKSSFLWRLIQRGGEPGAAFVAKSLHDGDWENPVFFKEFLPLFEQLVLSKERSAAIFLDKTLGKSFWAKHPRGAEFILKRIELGRQEPHSGNEWEYYERGYTERNRLMLYVFSQRHWRSHPRWLELINAFLADPEWSVHARFVKSVLGPADPFEESALFDVLELMLPKGMHVHSDIVKVIANHPQWLNHPKSMDFMLRMLEMQETVPSEVMREVLPKLNPHDPKVLELFEKCWAREKVFVQTPFIDELLPVAAWWEVPRVRELAFSLAKDRKFVVPFTGTALPKMGNHPAGVPLMEYFISDLEAEHLLDELERTLKKGAWEKHPQKTLLLQKINQKRPWMKRNCPEVLKKQLKRLLSG